MSLTLDFLRREFGGATQYLITRQHVSNTKEKTRIIVIVGTGYQNVQNVLQQLNMLKEQKQYGVHGMVKQLRKVHSK